MIPPPQQFRFREPLTASDLNRAQGGLVPTISALTGVPIVDGVLLTGQVLAVGDNIIGHGLGRELMGWIPVRLNAATSLYDKQATNAIPDKTLVLNSSAIATVTLWVF